MTRLPSDSFLPSGAFGDANDHHVSFTGIANGPPTSIISPLALPRSANHLSYFDDSHSNTSLPPSNYLQPTSHIQNSQHQRHLSPHRSSPDLRSRSGQRSASLSPTHYHVQPDALASPSLSAINELLRTTSPEQQLSAQAAAIQLRRVSQQNRRLLENWEAERAHLEANRARAEEIYREERSIMDEERLAWEAERQGLLVENQRMAAYIVTLELEKAELVKLAGSVNRNVDGAADSAIPGLRGGGKFSPEAVASGGPSATFRSPSDGLSPNGAKPIVGLGFTMPESQPFKGLDPLLQGSPPAVVSPGQQPEEKVPSIDINEIDSKLEGIPIKVTAVKKSTFTDGKSSPPQADSSKTSPPDLEKESPRSKSRASPTVITQETLQAPETARLTLHAGHTPNHSLSLIATAVSTDAPNTAGSSGASTPTLNPADSIVTLSVPPAAHTDGSGEYPAELEGNPEDIEAIYEPSDADPALTGPLMLRNRQASDEIFLSALNNKLESTRHDSTPTVLLRDEPAAPVAPAKAETAVEGDIETPGDGQHSAAGTDVPLKLKKNSNFGAPLGQLGSFSNTVS